MIRVPRYKTDDGVGGSVIPQVTQQVTLYRMTFLSTEIKPLPSSQKKTGRRILVRGPQLTGHLTPSMYGRKVTMAYKRLYTQVQPQLPYIQLAARNVWPPTDALT